MTEPANSVCMSSGDTNIDQDFQNLLLEIKSKANRDKVQLSAGLYFKS